MTCGKARLFTYTLIFVACGCGDSAGLVHAQTAKNASPLILNAKGVVVDVVVTDRRGTPVTGLKEQDFSVLEVGKEQTISAFAEHDEATSSGLSATLSTQNSLPRSVATNVLTGLPAEGTTVLLFDGLNTQLQDQIYVRREMLRFLEHPPHERMAIFTLGSRLRVVQSLTDDPALLAAVVSAGKNGLVASSPSLQSKADRTAQDQLSENNAQVAGLQAFLREVEVMEQRARVYQTLSAFRQIARYLSGIPGRKNLVWFSSGFPLSLSPKHPGDEEQDLQDEESKTAAALAAAEVAIYPIASEGLATDAISGADSQMPVHSAYEAQVAQAKMIHEDALERNAIHTAMDEIADDTGGKAFYNGNGLKEALEKSMRRASHYYTLFYIPSQRMNDGRFRSIRVKVNAKNVSLEYRRGYYAKAELKPVTSPNQSINEALRACMTPGFLGCMQLPMVVRLEKESERPNVGIANPALARETVQQSNYLVTVVLAERALSLKLGEDGVRRGSVDTALVVLDSHGGAVGTITYRIELAISPEEEASANADGVVLHLQMHSPPEGLTLRVGVYDAEADSVGSLEMPLQ